MSIADGTPRIADPVMARAEFAKIVGPEVIRLTRSIWAGVHDEHEAKLEVSCWALLLHETGQNFGLTAIDCRDHARTLFDNHLGRLDYLHRQTLYKMRDAAHIALRAGSTMHDAAKAAAAIARAARPQPPVSYVDDAMQWAARQRRFDAAAKRKMVAL